jgi:hypothetical protein
MDHLRYPTSRMEGLGSEVMKREDRYLDSPLQLAELQGISADYQRVWISLN